MGSRCRGRVPLPSVAFRGKVGFPLYKSVSHQQYQFQFTANGFAQLVGSIKSVTGCPEKTMMWVLYIKKKNLYPAVNKQLLEYGSMLSQKHPLRKSHIRVE